jgi:hypothetical protein
MNAARSIFLACLLAAASAVAAEPPPRSSGQTVYAPVYSHVLHGNQDGGGKASEWLLAAMLSVRNTDPARSMTVRSVRYYDSDGKLVREYGGERTLGPMATIEYFVEQRDKTGGSGANFLVVWDAPAPINAPIIETVHTYFFGTQSVTFVSGSQALHVK